MVNIVKITETKLEIDNNKTRNVNRNNYVKTLKEEVDNNENLSNSNINKKSHFKSNVNLNTKRKNVDPNG